MLEMLKQFDPEDIVVRARGLTVRRWQFAKMITDAAHVLRQAGLNPGDRVLLILPNSLELLVLYYACLADGLIAVPVSTRQARAEVDAICRNSQPSLLIHEHDGQPSWSSAFQIKSLAIDEIMLPEEQPAAITTVQWPGHQPAMIFYTSGSTGKPKGVLYSHATLRNNSRMCRQQYSFDSSDRSVLCHCMAHNFVFSQLCVPVLDAGGSVDVTDFGSVRQTANAVRDGATILKLIPWFAMDLFRYCQQQEIRPQHLKLCMIGGDRVPREAFELGEQVMGIGVSQNIGMTETNTYCADLAGTEHSKPGSTGLPLPGVDVDVRDGLGISCSAGQQGQIWVRSPANMIAYWRNEKATRDTVVDDWVATGDAGHLDPDGVLWFDSRIKHIIIRDGDNIIPAEVERAIAQHVSVSRVAVVGIPDAAHGESVAAVVVGEGGAGINPGELVLFLEPLISRSKIPRHWLQVDKLPICQNGKVDTPALHQLLVDSLNLPKTSVTAQCQAADQA